MVQFMQQAGIFLLILTGFGFLACQKTSQTDNPAHFRTSKLELPDAGSQNYYVFFTDKGSETIDTVELVPKTLLRRERQHLPLFDQRDLEVSSQYIEAVRQRVDSVRIVSRWLNAISIQASEDQLVEISQLTFVKSVRPFQSEAVLTQAPVSKVGEYNPRLDTLLSLSRGLLQLDSLLPLGLNGKGVRIAVLDAGFKGADRHPALAQLMARGGVLGSYDFYKDRENVYANSSHGLQVLSCMAGFYQARQMGAAPEADYLLARIVKQYFSLGNDEDLWIEAAEWAEENGADIINSSITYIDNYHTPGEMDGEYSPVSQAAKIATEKGILVVNAMGNEGDKRWKIMGAPADAPEVLSVGGSYPMVPLHLPMASTGPNARRQLKPNIAAPAFVLAAMHKNLYGESVGTSFSAPLIAGVAACILQQENELRPAELIKKMERAGHFYPYYDYDLGYGVPLMSRLLADSVPTAENLFHIELREDTVWVYFDTLYMRKDTHLFPYGRMLYYHFERPEQYLRAYQGFRIPNQSRSHYFLRRRPSFGKLRIWMDNYLYEQRFNGD